MTWNPEDFGGLTRVDFEQTEVWTPLIRAANSGFFAIDRDINLKVSSDGTVRWWPWAVFKGSCNIDLKSYPYDTQECKMHLSNWEHSVNEVNITNFKADPDFVYGPFEENPEWSVSWTVDTLVFDDFYDWKSALKINFTLKRRNSIYWYKSGLIKVSATLLSIASFFTTVGSMRRYFYATLGVFSYLIVLFQIVLDLGSCTVHVPNIGK